MTWSAQACVDCASLRKPPPAQACRHVQKTTSNICVRNSYATQASAPSHLGAARRRWHKQTSKYRPQGKYFLTPSALSQTCAVPRQHRSDRATHLCAHDVAQHRSDRIAAGELFFEARMLRTRLASVTDPTSSSAQVGNRSDVEYRLASG